MILADTSVWADHLRLSDPMLGHLLVEGEVAMHPFVLGEIALGFMGRRGEWLLRLRQLPLLHVADPEEILELIERRKLVAAGVGYVDVHLLASTLVTRECRLWTRDKRLKTVAEPLGVLADIDQ
jgi:predicted nucleic acid-binding protein